MKNNRGRVFLFTMGILILMSGIWELISTGCSVYAGYAVSEYVGTAARAAIFSGLAVFIGSAMAIGAGLSGRLESERKGRARLSIILGVIVVVVALPAVIFSWIQGYEFNTVSFVDGIVIPVLFLTASLIKK